MRTVALISAVLGSAFLAATARAQANGTAGNADTDAVATIAETERFAPTSRPTVPEPQRPPLSTKDNVDTGKPPHEWQRATDDWFGLRPWLDDRGVTFQASLTADTSWVASGGADVGDTAFRHLLSVNLTLNTERLIGWKGGTVFFSCQTQSGANGSASVGSVQGISNIDAEGLTQISELWYEQSLWDGMVRIKAGKVDAGAEFARVENGAEFINSSMGFSPTIVGFSSYPDPATSVNVFVNPMPWLYGGFGVYDGATAVGIPTGPRGPSTFFGPPGAAFLIGETGVKWGSELRGRLGLGVWRHTSDFDRFDGGTKSGTTGFYLVLDQTIWRRNPKDADDAQGIALFAQYGFADERISPVAYHVGVGLAWTGPIPSRQTDVLGLGTTYVRLSDEPGAGFDQRDELAVEMFYKLQVLKWLSVKLDFQYVHNPGGLREIRDALVATLRVQADL
jgi:carbohydrate-selective porin OprB